MVIYSLKKFKSASGFQNNYEEMENLIALITPACASLIFILMLTPLIRKFAIIIQLVDKPNARKVHHQPTPLVGGISIFAATTLALLLSDVFLKGIGTFVPLLTGSFVMLAMGAIDDKMNIKPIYRLGIQLICAYSIAASGIRIHSFYGIFGVTEIPILSQYFITILIIAGVVNAYNLMDGVDGLLASLALVTFLLFTAIAYRLRAGELTAMYLAISCSIVGFLRFNFSKKNKIFLGDAGSLLLGFILVVSGIYLLNLSYQVEKINNPQILVLVVGVFIVPVLDSLRVYRSRIKRGTSPFKADKTHLHHLFLFIGASHKKITLVISTASVLIALVSASLCSILSITWGIVLGSLLFAVFFMILVINHSVMEWRRKVEQLENKV